MGNPKGVTVGQPSTLDSGNGIMARVSGATIGATSRTLPPAETMEGQTATVEADDEYRGRVVITYVSKRLRHRKSSYCAWIATRVDSKS